MILRNKTKSWKHFPPPLSTSFPDPLPAPLSGTGEWRMQVVGSSRCLWSSFPLTLFPWSSRSLPWEIVHEIPLPTDCTSWTASVWVCSTGCSPSGAVLTSMGPLWSQKSSQQPCSSMGSSLHGFTSPGRGLLQCRQNTGSLPVSGIHLLIMEPTGCR